MKLMNFKKNRSRYYCAVSLLVLTVAMDAAAATKSNCVVNSVQYDNNRLAIWCNGDANIYYAFTSPSGDVSACAHTSSATMRIWVAMFQAALLSGRNIDFQYATPKTNCNLRNISWGVKQK